MKVYEGMAYGLSQVWVTSVIRHFGFQGFLNWENLKKPEKTEKKTWNVATWKPMSVFQETCLQGLARLSLVKSILTWPFTICSIYSHSRFPKFLETRKPVKTVKNWKLNCHIADVRQRQLYNEIQLRRIKINDKTYSSCCSSLHRQLMKMCERPGSQGLIPSLHHLSDMLMWHFPRVEKWLIASCHQVDVALTFWSNIGDSWGAQANGGNPVAFNPAEC